MHPGHAAKVFVPMCADFIHIGHVNILKDAASKGMVTILLMTDDAMKSYKRTPKMTYGQRYSILREFSTVSEIISCGGPDKYASMVRSHKPEYFVHGDDWKTGPQSDARQAVLQEMKKYGGHVIEPNYTKNVSSTMLQNMFMATIQESTHYGIATRGVLNDLKRTPAIIENETGVSASVIESLIKGQNLDCTDIDAMHRVLHNTYPVSRRQLVVDSDDSREGVWYNSHKQTTDSARVLNRVNALEQSVPYYKYMDTATSAISPFKPELIEQLVEVADDDPYNPLVVMNKGHLLTQLTFFIGPVNFYCTIRGVRYCKQMNTGDSCFIIPYIPHSFTSRDLGTYTAIVAVTFSGHVRDVFNDLMHHDMQKIMHHAGDRRNKNDLFIKKLERFSNLRGTTPEKIKMILLAEGYSIETLENVFVGGSQDTLVIQKLASILAIPSEELMISQLNADEEVTYASTPFETKEPHPIDCKTPLATNLHFPDVGGYEWTLSGSTSLISQYFDYIYNYGKSPVTIEWLNHSQILEPGGSVLLKPFIDVTYTSRDSVAHLVVCKVGGCVNNRVMHECSLFEQHGLKTTTKNICQWW